MKKSLVALAALAVVGAASAQSSVTLSGIIKGGVARTKYTNGATGNGSNNGVADGSSRFIISGREDLGGGLAAIFQIDTRFRVDDNGAAPTTSPLATGNTFVGLAGGFGSLRIGKLDTHYCTGSDEHGSRATALGASSCGILGYVQGLSQSIANASRSTNVIRYDLPSTMMAGLTGGITYSTAFANQAAQVTDGAMGAAGGGKTWSANVGYATGPLKLAASYWKAQSEDRTATAVRRDQKAWTLAGGWNFGLGTIGVTYDVSAYDKTNAPAPEINGENKRRAWSVPLTFGVGAGTILATYTKAYNVKTPLGTIANSGASLWAVGYDYAFSKRTSVGVSYAVMNNKTNASYQLYTTDSLQGLARAVAGQDAKQLYVGIRHAF
jgi:predicted porin